MRLRDKPTQSVKNKNKMIKNITNVDITKEIENTCLGVKNIELENILCNIAEYFVLYQDACIDSFDDIRDAANDYENAVIDTYIAAGQAIHGYECFGGGDVEAINDIYNETDRLCDLIVKNYRENYENRMQKRYNN